MEASRFSSSKESAPYTKCSEGDIHCGVWHWWSNTAPRCISNADGKRCLLLHVPAAPPSFSAQEKTTTLGGRKPHHSSWQIQGVAPLLLSRTSCIAGNGRFWNIHRTHPIWVHAITISSPKLLFLLGFTTLFNILGQGSSTRGPRAVCGPGRIFHCIQCVMNIEAWVTRHYMTKGK